MRFLGQLTSRALVWLAAAWFPFGSLAAGVCDCAGGHAAPAVSGATHACGAAHACCRKKTPSHACCGTGHRCNSPCCQGSAICTCHENRPAEPVSPPSDHSPNGKHLVSEAPALALMPATLDFDGSSLRGLHLASPRSVTPLERCSTLCRFLI